MEQNKWVDDRLAKLNPDGEWQPRVNAALDRFEGRRTENRRIGPGPRALSIVAVAVICVVTFPQPRAFAQRVLAPCVEACQNLVLNHEDIHEHIYHLLLGF